MRARQLIASRAWMLMAVVAATSACTAAGATGARPRPFPTYDPLASAITRRAASLPPDIRRVIQAAVALQGTPYVFGGEDPSGFDCSGFVRYVFGRQRIEIPRTVVEQFGVGSVITATDLRAGDLVFFSTIAPGPSHVGIALGASATDAGAQAHAFIHAPGDNGFVRIDWLDDPYWQARFVAARRLF